MAHISVLIPSRLEQGKNGRLLLERAVQSIRDQMTAEFSPSVQILVGLDEGTAPPDDMAARLGIRFIKSESRSQAGALNAAGSVVEGDYVAVLEDDDQWNPGFLSSSLLMLKDDFDFSSSTQLEITPDNKVIRVQEFPTPSGWVMRRAIWDQVGPFNPDYRFHLDNEWLGRLGETSARRVHLVEATTPIDYDTIPQSRPFLGQLLAMGRPKVTLARHDSPWPLVVRLCHPGSGMARIKNDPALQQQSESEVLRLQERFGRFPW